jgi:D-alanine-D-alanine ligase
MRIAILHNAVADDAPPEDRDTLVQVEVVAEALARLGHEPIRISCTLDLASMCDDLRQVRPDVVFNLAEALGNSDSLVYVPLAVLDTLKLPYTGSRTEALFLTTHKVLAKRQMCAAGLPTPPWVENGVPNVVGNVVADVVGTLRVPKPSADNPRQPCDCRHVECADRAEPRASWILKGVWDQGSLGMEDDAVLKDVDASELHDRLGQWTAQQGRPCFAERFIEGREFAVTMLTGADGPIVLAPAEIEFPGFPPDKPRIVGYRAKWREDCFEYHQTPRRFDFAPGDRPLLDEIRRLATACWRLFKLRGWARVDFRVDAAGQPWILEVNANPCLSPDAGYVAALEQDSITFDEAIRRILEDCVV